MARNRRGYQELQESGAHAEEDQARCSSVTQNRACVFLREHGVLPPREKLAHMLTRTMVILVWVGVMWAILGEYMYFTPVHLNTTLNKGSCEVNSSDITNSTSFNSTASSNALWNFCQMKKINVLTISFWESSSTREAIQALCNKPETNSSKPGLFDIEKGHFFGLIVLGIVASLAGFLVGLIRLPPLLGMLIAGVVLNNTPYITVTRLINPSWSSMIRSIALTVILTRGGIAMDASALKKNLLPVLALAALPCLIEGGIIALITAFYLRLKWQWAIMIGYLLAAISPAVLVPSILHIQTKKPPNTNEILPTILIVSGAFDDVICIALFGVFLGLTFSRGTHLALAIAEGPIEVALGLTYGVVVGVVLWYLPSARTRKDSKVVNRILLLVGFALFGLFGAQRIKVGGTGLIGAGALSVLVVAFMAHLKWKNDQSTSDLKQALGTLWNFLQPFLFGLIGAAVDVYSIDPQIIGKAVLLIVCGLVARLTIVALIGLARRLPWRHIVFSCMCWIPKATVQAALVGVVLDIASENGSPEEECNASIVLTLTVLIIIITAPLGATLVGVFGPNLLYSLPLCPMKCRRASTEDVQNEEEGLTND